MKKATYFFIVCMILVPIAVACNLYGPFGSVGTDEDHIEEALKCLHQTPADFACAVAHYSIISDAELKSQKLCSVYLAQAGLTLTAMINQFDAVNGSSAGALGNLANSLIPWSAARTTAAGEAKTQCAAYAAAASDSDFGALLKNLSYFVSCGLLMAKTDQRVATSVNDTACTTAGNGDQTITQSDIGDNADGTITDKGMCPGDVAICRNDLSSLNVAELANLDELEASVDELPAEALTAGDLTVDTAKQALVRKGLRDSISTR